MKKIAFLLMIAVIAIIGCKEDKKAKLDDLRKKQAEIVSQIKQLEDELKSEGGDVTTSDKSTKVTLSEVKIQEFSHYIDAQGRVDGEENVIATAMVPGIVTKIHVTEGQFVQKGQLLVELDAGVLLQTLKEMEISLEFITDLYEKQKALWEQQIGSEVQYLSAKTNKESMEGRIKTMKEQLDMYRIKSPITGTVEELPVKVGQAVAPGLVAIRVVNFSRVKIMADLSEAHAAKIKKGDEVIITFNGVEPIRADVGFASKYINPMNRTFLVEIYLKPGNMEYRANMMANVQIRDYFKKEAIIIPVSLIQNDGKTDFVFLAEPDGKGWVAKKTPVKQGLSYNGMVEITEGLIAGNQLITTGYLNVLNGEIIQL